MIIFLPCWGISVNSLITELNQDNLNYWISCFESDSVDLYLPRFKLEWGQKLNDVLTSLGMGIAFEPGVADFTEMYEGGGVWISEVKHKSFIEVNEEGTEAAAATVVVMAESGEPMGLEIMINRPFLFMIRENVSGTILFIGKIVDPGYEES